jgi:hypothetical protein
VWTAWLALLARKNKPADAAITQKLFATKRRKKAKRPWCNLILDSLK